MKHSYCVPSEYKRGTHPNCRNGFKRIYSVNEDTFKNYDSVTAYWAGLIAADGNIFKRSLTLSAAEKDKESLNKFKDFIKAENPISCYTIQDKYRSCQLVISSKVICDDLTRLWNITPKKSLTLQPPPIEDVNLIDAYIVGYIDGDGSTGLYKSKRQDKICITIIGTLELCTWIKNRFETIIGKSIKNVCKYHPKISNVNTYRIYVSDKNARKLFLHYYNIKLPRLPRKWTEEMYNHCLNFKKFINYEKYESLVPYFKAGNTDRTISDLTGMSPSLIAWYRRSSIIKKMLHETSLKDKDVADIEEE